MMLTGLQLLYQLWSKYFLKNSTNGGNPQVPNEQGHFSSNQWENEASEYAFNAQEKRYYRGGATVPQAFSGPYSRINQ